MNDPTLPTDWDRPITTDQRHYSLIANNIATKLTNQFLRSGLRTFDWQQLWNWLWCASPLPTTVLLRTAHTRTIKVHYYMLPGFKPFTVLISEKKSQARAIQSSKECSKQLTFPASTELCKPKKIWRRQWEPVREPFSLHDVSLN